ncbi:MAG: alpha-ribazole phosphatase [Leptospiraceae bacterium]|nr:alpha-ribazole phosphatase [Leptospiraceae bacterium]MBP9163157.1 alpha-ribazole phosphatase [Leptospiraceae bacterium]
MEIYLVRHTKVSIAENTCYGNSDIGLAESFLREAEVVKSKIPNLENLVCYSSPLTRCKFLSEELNCKEIRLDPRLKELNFGDWELNTWDSIGKQAFDAWHLDFVNNRTPDGESYFELYTRAVSFWQEITNKKDSLILITHGGVIRALLAHILGMPLENSFRIKVDYGSVSKVILSGEFLTVEYINR